MDELRDRSHRRSRAGSVAMRALRGARDLYVRGLRGLDRLVAAANPRASVGRPSSRVFGCRDSEQELRELVRAMEARRAPASAGAVDRREKAEAGAVRRGGMPLESINEDAAMAHPTRRGSRWLTERS
jgi:hypothetical protein